MHSMRHGAQTGHLRAKVIPGVLVHAPDAAERDRRQVKKRVRAEQTQRHQRTETRPPDARCRPPRGTQTPSLAVHTAAWVATVATAGSATRNRSCPGTSAGRLSAPCTAAATACGPAAQTARTRRETPPHDR
eukprot:ctg_504.g305